MTATLFEQLPPCAAARDPDTSKLAGAEQDATGKRRTDAAAVAELVRRHEGCTSLELSRLTNTDRHWVAKRLPDAERMGLCQRSHPRKCTVSGKLALTWYGTSEGSMGNGE